MSPAAGGAPWPQARLRVPLTGPGGIDQAAAGNETRNRTPRREQEGPAMPAKDRPAASRRTRRTVHAVRSVVVQRPLEATMRVVRDIELLEPLERKARAVSVHPERDDSGWYRITGRLAGLVSWDGTFSYRQHDNGWHSADVRPRPDGWRISGGFVVTPIDETSCRITHYEDYTLPQRLRRLHLPLVAYMRFSQIGEMRDLRRLVHDRVAVAPGAASDPDRPRPPVGTAVGGDGQATR